MIIPPVHFCGVQKRDFDLKNESMRKKLWVGKVELLFHAEFAGPNGRMRLPLALVSCLYDLEIPELLGPLHHEYGSRMFYEPTEKWLWVTTVKNIIGRAPLVKAYIDGGLNNTIPHRLGHLKASKFKYGRADLPNHPGTGSRVFELNTLLWNWGRVGWNQERHRDEEGAGSGGGSDTGSEEGSDLDEDEYSDDDGSE
jgi:hypothetical protein